MELNIRTSERIYDWDARDWPFVDGQMILPGDQNEYGWITWHSDDVV